MICAGFKKGGIDACQVHLNMKHHLHHATICILSVYTRFNDQSITKMVKRACIKTGIEIGRICLTERIRLIFHNMTSILLMHRK